MAVDSDPVDVDERMAVRKLLDRILMVGQRIVPHVAVTVVVVPFRPARMASSLADRYDDETCLGQTVGTHAHACERIIYRLNLRTRIDIVHDRVDLGRIEVERLVHDSVKVCHSVSGLDLE